MADKRISELTAASSVNAADLVVLSQGGGPWSSVKATITQLAAAILPATVSEAEAEAGTSTTVRSWTAQRVRDAILGWWDGSSAKTKLDGIEEGAEVNAVDSVAGKTGVVTLVKADVGLGNVDNTSDASKPVSAAQQTALDARLKIDGSNSMTGNLGIGTTTPGYTGWSRAVSVEGATNAGVEISSLRADVDGGSVGGLDFFFQSNTAGHKRIAAITGWSSGGTANQRGGRVVIQTKPNASTTMTDRMQFLDTGAVVAGADNTQTFGSGSLRWSVIYAGTGTINTSDAREKTAVRDLTENEIAASRVLAREIGAYRFLDAIAAKGDAARDHIGLTVQRAIDIMGLHGLDPMRYGFICYDAWEAVSERPPVMDEEGNEVEPGAPAREAGDRYSFRPDELLLFIARGLEARLSALEA